MNLFWHKLSTNKKFDLNSFLNTKKNNFFANWSPYSRVLLYYNFFIKNSVAKYKITDLVNHLNKKDVPKFNLKLGINIMT